VAIIRSGLFISLDGVVESPNLWHFPYFDDEMGAAVGAMMAGNDAMLIGRRTYEEFASFWPTADPDDPATAQMNGTRKYVVSTTLTNPTWEHSTVVSGDVKTEIAKLKQDRQLGTEGPRSFRTAR
jgi:dihydrofolate reductase